MRDQLDLVAVKRLQLRHQMRHAIGKAKLHRLSAHPDIGVEQVGFRIQTLAPTVPDMVDERLMDRGLQRLQPLHILGLLRQERVGNTFRFARRDHPPFHPLPGHKVWEPERREDHPDRPHKGTCIHPDVIRSTSQPIPARSRHIFDKGMDRNALFIGQPADARGNQRRLHCRPTRRVNLQGHRNRLALEGALDQRGKTLIIQGSAAGANGAAKADHRDKGRFRPEGDETTHGREVSLQGLAGKGGARQAWQMIDKLEMFIALAKERHFGRAAEACGVTQPSLSSAIRQLEDQLGVQLVFRGSRFQGLTPEGQRVLDRALGIVGDVRALKDEMRVVRTGLSGNLRLGVIPTALPMVADLTDPFTAKHPNVRVSILSRTSVEILTGIEALDLEAGITYLDNEPLGRVSQVPLYTEFYRLLIAPGSDLAGRRQVSWSELSTVPLCLLTSDMQNRRIVNQHLGEAGVASVPMIESNSTMALVAHVLTGRWASVVPKKLADMFIADGRLLSIPIVDPEAEHTVGLIAARRDPQTPVLQALMDEAVRLFR